MKNIKRIISIILLAVMTIAVVGCTESNNVPDEVKELAEYRTQAIAEVESYAESKGQDNYSEENWAQIQGIVRDTITSIQVSNSRDDIAGMITTAKTNIDKILTYKQHAITELQSYADEKGEDNYSEEKWLQIQGIVHINNNLIKAGEANNIDEILIQAKLNIDGVLRKDEEQAVAELQSYADEKGEDNYYAYNWSVIQRIVEESKTEMQKTEDEIRSIVSEAKRQIDEIRTKEQEESGDLGPEPTNEEDLKYRARQWQLLIQVKEYWSEVTLAYIEEITFEIYLGCYNGSIVAMYDWGEYALGYGDGMESVEIEGYVFRWTGPEIEVYKNKKFYSLYEAYYEAKILTIEDIKIIYERYYDFIDPDDERFESYPNDPMNPNNN